MSMLDNEQNIETPFFQINEDEANDIRAALNENLPSKYNDSGLHGNYQTLKLEIDENTKTFNNQELYSNKDKVRDFKDLLTDTHIKAENVKIPTPIQYQELLKHSQPKTKDKDIRNTLIELSAQRTSETAYVNNLKSSIIITQLSVDTKFRKNYFSTSPSNYTINLATPLKNVISMRLASLEIPNVQHVVSASSGTNSFTVSHSNRTRTVEIPSGNYEGWLLADVLNADREPSTNIEKEPYGKGGGLNEFDLDIHCDTKTMRTTIKSIKKNPAGEPVPVEFSIDFTNPTDETAPPMKSLGWILGFRKRKYEGAKSYVSEAAVDLAGSRYIFMCINDFNSSVHEVVTVLYENSFLRKNILARIPMREGKGVVLFDDCTDKITKKRHYFGPVNINKLEVKLLDEYGCPIDLVGVDYSFALEFQILYEK